MACQIMFGVRNVLGAGLHHGETQEQVRRAVRPASMRVLGRVARVVRVIICGHLCRTLCCRYRIACR
jgi:hypothetical protein